VCPRGMKDVKRSAYFSDSKEESNYELPQKKYDAKKKGRKAMKFFIKSSDEGEPKGKLDGRFHLLERMAESISRNNEILHKINRTQRFKRKCSVWMCSTKESIY
jgi:hypothetical protein